MSWDIFISHSSEDKNDFVRPLANYLRSQRIRIWYDEFTIGIGDSLREKIDEGIRESKYGLVILSKSFIEKEWTRKELNGLFSKEIYTKEDILLPIWLDITPKEIFDYSPILSDKLSLLATKEEIKEIGDKIIERIKYDRISEKEIQDVLDKFNTNNEFDIKNRISEIEYRLEKLYNYENEIVAIETPNHLKDSENYEEIEKYFAPLYESIDRKYDFPLGIWYIRDFDEDEYYYIKDKIGDWVLGTMSYKEIDDFFFELDFMINIDMLYIFFGFANDSVKNSKINLRDKFYEIGTKNFA